MKGWKIGLGVLVLFYVGALLALFLAPYTPSQQFRQLAYAPPTGIHFRDHDGVWHLRPFIYSYHRLGLQTRYRPVRYVCPSTSSSKVHPTVGAGVPGASICSVCRTRPEKSFCWAVMDWAGINLAASSMPPGYRSRSGRSECCWP